MGKGGKLSAAAARIAAKFHSGAGVEKRTWIAPFFLVAALGTVSLGGALAGVASWNHRTDRSGVTRRISDAPPVATIDLAPSSDGQRNVAADQTSWHPSHDNSSDATVSTAPEPSTLVIAVTMAMSIGCYAWLRRGTAEKVPNGSPPSRLPVGNAPAG
jgi:hypothetical protein